MNENDAREIQAYKRIALGRDRDLELKYAIIPYIAKEPTLEMFGLEPDAKEKILEFDRAEASYGAARRQAKHTLVSIWIGVAWLMILAVYAFSDYGFGMSVVAGLSFFLVPFFYFEAVLSNRVMPSESEYNSKMWGADRIRRNYEEYEERLALWEYWEKRRTCGGVWGLLNADEFMATLQQIYRQHGFRFDARYAKGTYDFILQKTEKKTLGHCVPLGRGVSADVIQRLVGERGFDRFMVVTLTSVTEDVGRFAKQNNVELVDVQALCALVAGI